MSNPFVHVELMTGDIPKAKAFYGSLFGWKLEDVPGMDYTIVNVGEGTGGGMMKLPMPDMPPHWLPYVLVDDVDASVASALSLGATLRKGKTEVPGMGWFAVLLDPTGAGFALWQAQAP